jgi:hypothetical protein
MHGLRAQVPKYAHESHILFCSFHVGWTGRPGKKKNFVLLGLGASWFSSSLGHVLASWMNRKEGASGKKKSSRSRAGRSVWQLISSWTDERTSSCFVMLTRSWFMHACLNYARQRKNKRNGWFHFHPARTKAPARSASLMRRTVSSFPRVIYGAPSPSAGRDGGSVPFVDRDSAIAACLWPNKYSSSVKYSILMWAVLQFHL